MSAVRNTSPVMGLQLSRPEVAAALLKIVLQVQLLSSAQRCFWPGRDLGEAGRDLQRGMWLFDCSILWIQSTTTGYMAHGAKVASDRLQFLGAVRALMSSILGNCEIQGDQCAVLPGKDSRAVLFDALAKAGELHLIKLSLGCENCPVSPPEVENTRGSLVFREETRCRTLMALYRFARAVFDHQMKRETSLGTPQEILQELSKEEQNCEERIEAFYRMKVLPLQELLMRLVALRKDLENTQKRMKGFQREVLDVLTERKKILDAKVEKVNQQIGLARERGSLPDLPPETFEVDVLRSAFETFLRELFEPPKGSPTSIPKEPTCLERPNALILREADFLAVPLESSRDEGGEQYLNLEEIQRRAQAQLPEWVEAADFAEKFRRLVSRTLILSMRFFLQLQPFSFRPIASDGLLELVSSRWIAALQNSLERNDFMRLLRVFGDYMSVVASAIKVLSEDPLRAHLLSLYPLSPPKTTRVLSLSGVGKQVCEALLFFQREYPERGGRGAGAAAAAAAGAGTFSEEPNAPDWTPSERLRLLLERFSPANEARA